MRHQARRGMNERAVRDVDREQQSASQEQRDGVNEERLEALSPRFTHAPINTNGTSTTTSGRSAKRPRAHSRPSTRLATSGPRP